MAEVKKKTVKEKTVKEKPVVTDNQFTDVKDIFDFLNETIAYIEKNDLQIVELIEEIDTKGFYKVKRSWIKKPVKPVLENSTYTDEEIETILTGLIQ